MLEQLHRCIRHLQSGTAKKWVWPKKNWIILELLHLCNKLVSIFMGIISHSLRYALIEVYISGMSHLI